MIDKATVAHLLIVIKNAFVSQVLRLHEYVKQEHCVTS